MSFTLPYTALVSASDVVAESIGSVDLKQDDPNFDQYLNRAIAAATDAIESRLNRKFITRAYTSLVKRGRWRYNSVNSRYAAWSPAWPIVEIETTTVTIGNAEGRDGGLFLTTAPGDLQIDYFAGYRRNGQALEQLQQETALADLTVEPEQLPSEVHGACIDIALYLIARRAKGPGESTRNLTVGGATVSVTRSDQRFIEEVCESLYAYRGPEMVL